MAHSESSSGILDTASDAGWEDVESDDDSQPIVGLFSTTVYPDVHSMLKESRDKHNFDLVKVKKELDLDLIETIKLVNYIRSQVKAGNLHPDVSSKSLFDEDLYLKPTLEDDALLYNLEDLEDDVGTVGNTKQNAEKQVVELQEELDRLQGQFSEYRLAVQRSMTEQLSLEDETVVPDPATGLETVDKAREADLDYFSSYSYNAIHESMLKDAVRTDAYRDFIYDNKHLFKDKVVLDVGCGTGILSMFCAKAEAKLVIAVDNSSIIEKAREIVYENGFGNVIRCIHGKIEEVSLPVSKVDIIVSEWMGYGLLFEAMLDSVLWARDRYLTPGGLMVPSHVTLRISPFADSELVCSQISFWKSVYGFKMSSMLTNIYDEVLVSPAKPSSVAADSVVFLQLPLHTASVEELTFVKDVEVTLTKDIHELDGWVVWFDVFFMPSHTSLIPEDAVPSHMKRQGYVAFTTGPDGPETHWQQCLLLINHGKDAVAIKKGQVIKVQVGYRKKEEKSRSLDIEMQWDEGDAGKGSQRWSLQ